jgi:hypothetical protein
MHAYNIMLALSETKNMWVQQLIFKNFGVEIQNNLNSVKNMPKVRLSLNFTSTKFKELLEKCWEGLSFNKIVTIYIHPLL